MKRGTFGQDFVHAGVHLSRGELRRMVKIGPAENFRSVWTPDSALVPSHGR